MNIIQTVYKDEVIQFFEFSEDWTWNSYSNKSLAKVKAYIDRAQKKDFERLPAYLIGWREIKQVEITSLVNDDQCWCVDKNGNRSKEDLKSMYLFNDKNTTLLETKKRLEEKIKELTDEIKSTLEQMDKLKFS